MEGAQSLKLSVTFVQAKNEMQDRVINEAVSIVCQSNRYRPRVYIVQGPPGTGLNIIRVGHEIYSSKQASYREQRELEQGKLAEADVVFSTLNYVGNSIFDSFGSDTNQSPWFDCLIVDEAGQCLEIDTFIPLRLRIPCMLLFGDPEQLPATVLSQRAQNANFGQSLLARLYSLFKSTDLIRMLNINFRSSHCHRALQDCHSDDISLPKDSSQSNLKNSQSNLKNSHSNSLNSFELHLTDIADDSANRTSVLS
ncbi:unnamed protein product [Rotaria magnacalcarata]|uniref:DNA2/NAM7 helicase helicase domain-containing protein n=1 Tax=Rotaria magnacalcarata TaxID=392030 RepID=A0A8S3G1C0_9BILA|nr:unnamed protein product [Rotaria magnacalcarata]